MKIYKIQHFCHNLNRITEIRFIQNKDPGVCLPGFRRTPRTVLLVHFAHNIVIRGLSFFLVHSLQRRTVPDVDLDCLLVRIGDRSTTDLLCLRLGSSGTPGTFLDWATSWSFLHLFPLSTLRIIILEKKEIIIDIFELQSSKPPTDLTELHGEAIPPTQHHPPVHKLV